MLGLGFRMDLILVESSAKDRRESDERKLGSRAEAQRGPLTAGETGRRGTLTGGAVLPIEPRPGAVTLIRVRTFGHTHTSVLAWLGTARVHCGRKTHT